MVQDGFPRNGNQCKKSNSKAENTCSLVPKCKRKKKQIKKKLRKWNLTLHKAGTPEI